MNTQFKFEKQTLVRFTQINPEQVIMIELQRSMKRLNIRSFKSYLKWVGTTRIQRTSISLNEISDLLNINIRESEDLAYEWRNNIGGTVVHHAGINAYYFAGVYEIIN